MFYFLQTRYQTSFEEYITTGVLLKAVLFFALLTAALVTFTYVYLGLKKRSFFFKDRIKKSLELWISNVILSEDEEAEIQIPEKFRKMFRNPTARQYAIEHLITNKKTFSGAVAVNIRHLYETLGFKNDSIKKLQSRTWFIRAKGIQELAIMDQNDLLIRIYRLTNSKNELVRNEAQNAIIQWAGFNGLRFLDVVSYDISDWQQVQLLVLLKNFTSQDMPKLAVWLSSKNDTVVIFALKLAESYQSFNVKKAVEKCLQHANEKVRMQAVTTLGKIGDEESADRMISLYNNELFRNQVNILEKIPLIGGDYHIPFLEEQLSNENDFLKLSAAKAIGKMRRMGLLEQKAKEQPERYEAVFKHVKAELSL